ncbi:MAG: 50S ribosomal protein L32 [Patescibacteria group bacterium]
MVVRMRLNRSQRNNRRSQQAYKGNSLILCPECGARKMPHRACDNCGMYKGRMVIDVNAQMARKQRRHQAKMVARGEETSDEKKTTEVKGK